MQQPSSSLKFFLLSLIKIGQATNWKKSTIQGKRVRLDSQGFPDCDAECVSKLCKASEQHLTFLWHNLDEEQQNCLLRVPNY